MSWVLISLLEITVLCTKLIFLPTRRRKIRLNIISSVTCGEQEIGEFCVFLILGILDLCEQSSKVVLFLMEYGGHRTVSDFNNRFSLLFRKKRRPSPLDSSDNSNGSDASVRSFEYPEPVPRRLRSLILPRNPKMDQRGVGNGGGVPPKNGPSVPLNQQNQTAPPTAVRTVNPAPVQGNAHVNGLSSG